MNLKLRRALYLSFFLIFIAVIGWLLLYLQGFRYNPAKHKLERTGAIMVDSAPSGATIVLNGSIQNKETTATIQPLKPGDYETIVNLPGFQTWRKILNVKPSRVTFTGRIRLWPPPATGDKLNGTDLITSVLAPNGENLLYYSNTGLSSGLSLFNLASGKASLLARPSNSTILAADWSPDSHEILINEKSSAGISWRIFNLEYATWEQLTLPADTKPVTIRWGDSTSSLYLSTHNELYQWIRRGRNLKLVWRETMVDFRVHDGLIFGLTRQPNGVLSLKILNQSNLQLVPLEDPPILSTNVVFLEARQDWLPLFDQDRHTLYLLHSPLTELKPVRRLPEVVKLDWSADGNRLLLANNFEIWEYRIEEDRLNLLLRVSTPLVQARAYGQEPYLIYATDQEVWALELDTRNEQQRWLLAKYDSEIDDFFIDPAGRTLNVKTRRGLYRLRLIAEPEPAGGALIKD
jgi:hypothetical protein